MKKILAMAAVAALSAGASAYAANPFSDVSTSDWAYQAVADLSDQGIVEGYPDGTFQGQTNITRYEMAQIIARLMAREDQYNAEQRATIDKLAGEYADELDSLGVRVSNLEKKVGNISWSGDARMRYQDKVAGDNWDGRLRINMKGQVNENTTINGRFVSEMNFKDGDDADTDMDVLNVTHKFGDAATVKLGRYGILFGNQGGWFYGSAKGFDGAEAAFNLGKNISVTAGYGQFNAGDVKLDGETEKDALLKDHDAIYARAKGNLGAATLGVDYINFKDGIEVVGPNYTPELLGVNLNVPVGDFRVFGEYWKNTTAETSYDTAWNAGIGYGTINYAKAGTYAIDLAYNDVDAEAYFGGTGAQTDMLDQVWYADNLNFWNAIAEVTLAKNTYLHAEYAFAADAEHGEDPDDAWTVSLNYKF